MSNTRDLMNFGYRELSLAGELLTLFKTEKDNSTLDSNVAIEFNPNSGLVFMVDEDYSAAHYGMLIYHELE